MSQFDFGTIDTVETDGTELAVLLQNFRTALNSGHSGTARPSYVIPGMMWIDTSGATWALKMFDGDSDVTVGTIDTANNKFFSALFDFMPEATVPSAATTDIHASNSFRVVVSGTVTITSFGTRANSVKLVRFSGALTLTQGANLLLPGGANLKTRAGDTCIVSTDASGVSRVYAYTRADGSGVMQPEFATLASAATTSLSSVPNKNINITGTTNISSFGAGNEGDTKCLVFAGALTLLYNATSMILPNGGSNIATVAGDSLTAVCLGGSNWKIVNYQQSSTIGTTSVSQDMFYSTISSLALMIADVRNADFPLSGGWADAYDDETGVNRGSGSNVIDSNTVAYLPMNGTINKAMIWDRGWDAYTVFDNNNARQWRVVGASGAVYLDTSQSKFGGSSLRFNSAVSGWITGNGDTDLAFPVGTDFTIDLFFRLASVGVQQTIIEFSPTTSSGGRNLWYVTSGNKLTWYFANSDRITSTTTLAVNTWYHAALVMDNGNLSMYINGVQEGVTFNWGLVYDWSNHPTYGVFIGVDIAGTTPLNAWLDHVRWRKNVKDFSVPTAEMALPTNTSTLNQIYSSSGDYYSPKALGKPVYGQVFENSASGVTRSHRLNIPARKIESGGTYVRVRFNGGPIVGTINRAYIGQKAASGNLWDMTGTLGQLKYNGATAIPLNGAPVWSDWVLFTVDPTKEHMITLDYTHTSGSWPYNAQAGDSYIHFKTGVFNEAATLAPTGYTSAAAQTYMVDAIEVKSVAAEYENMVIESATAGAVSVPSTGRISLQTTSASDTFVVNTDLVAKISRDAGVTWTTVPLTMSVNSGGLKQFDGKVDISAQPSGTSMRYQISTPTGLNIIVTAVTWGWY